MTILTMAIADALAIASLCTLYLVRHRNRELMISYAVINAGIFTVSVALVSAGSNASAMGMGLFGVLSIIRLRSTALSQREVGYYFVALSVGMIAGINISPAYIAFGLMATLVALIAILDSRSAPVSTEKTQDVTADRAMSDEEELKAYLGARLGLHHHRGQGDRAGPGERPDPRHHHLPAQGHCRRQRPRGGIPDFCDPARGRVALSGGTHRRGAHHPGYSGDFTSANSRHSVNSAQ